MLLAKPGILITRMASQPAFRLRTAVSKAFVASRAARIEQDGTILWSGGRATISRMGGSTSITTVGCPSGDVSISCDLIEEDGVPSIPECLSFWNAIGQMSASASSSLEGTALLNDIHHALPAIREWHHGEEDASGRSMTFRADIDLPSPWGAGGGRIIRNLPCDAAGPGFGPQFPVPRTFRNDLSESDGEFPTEILRMVRKRHGTVAALRSVRRNEQSEDDPTERYTLEPARIQIFAFETETIAQIETMEMLRLLEDCSERDGSAEDTGVA
jgi:hypothetical protein